MQGHQQQQHVLCERMSGVQKYITLNTPSMNVSGIRPFTASSPPHAHPQVIRLALASYKARLGGFSALALLCEK